MKNEYIFEKDEKGEVIAINVATGTVHKTVQMDVIPGSFILTPEQQELRRKQQEQRQANYYKKQANKELGNFYFMHHDEDFPDLSPQTAARLVYLNTYSSYEKNGTNLLVDDAKTKKPIKRADLPEILKLSNGAVSAFLDEVTPKYITQNQDGTYSSNTDIFMKRRLKHKGEYTHYHKMYINGIQKIYQAITLSTQHRYIGYLFKMLPYINYEYNILCHNPAEKELKNIELMTVGEFCEKINFDVSHVNRLKNVYKKLRFEVDGEQVRFCAFVSTGEDAAGMRIFVNPRVLYNGSDYQKVEVLAAFCD